MTQFVRRVVLGLILVTVLSLAELAVRQSHQYEQQTVNSVGLNGRPTVEVGKESLWQAASWEPITTFTACLAILTFGLVVVAFVQIRFLIRADRASTATSKAAELAATSASESAVIARTTLENTIRAFVDFFKFDAHHCADEHGLTHVSAFMTIVNNGQTSTRMAETATNWLFLPSTLPDDFSFPDIIRAPSYGGHTQRLSLGAKIVKTGARANIPIEMIIRVYERTGHLYIWGWIEYNDVLPTTSRHRSEFAGEITVSRHPLSLTPNDMPMGRHMGIRSLSTHNGSDQECYRQPGEPLPSYIAHAGARQDLPPDDPANAVTDTL